MFQKLVRAQVKEIRKRLRRGELVKNVARDFLVSRRQIYRIKHRERWKSV